MARVLLVVAFLLASVGARAACPGTPSDCPSPTYNNLTAGGTVGGAGFVARLASPGAIGTTAPSVGHFTNLDANGNVTGVGFTNLFNGPPPIGGVLYATTYGVSAASSSNDVALAAAAAACSMAGGELILPPGIIQLTGVAQITLNNCAMRAPNIPTGATGAPLGGTVFELTSTVTAPFIGKNNWSIFGVTFYWPNQTTGNAFYPPAIIDDGVTGFAYFNLDHITVINAYDFLKQSPNTGGGAYSITNSEFFASDAVFSLSDVGDTIVFYGNKFNPGPWLGYCNFTCETAVNTAIQTATVWHATAQSGAGLNIVAHNNVFFGWRYAILVDATGSIGISDFEISGSDGVGTWVDTSSGGAWDEVKFSGMIGGCGSVPQFGTSWLGNYTCFNMGANSSLEIDGLRSFGAVGTFIKAGANFHILKNIILYGVGSVADGSDYYAVLTTASPSQLTIENNVFSGGAGVHVHGINTASHAPAVTTIIGNTFQNFNDDLDLTNGGAQNTITGNSSINTAGSASVIFASPASGFVAWSGNNFDKPPLATVHNCGSSPTITGTLSGTVTTGSGTVNSCQITLPFTPLNGSGSCLFLPSGATLTSVGPFGGPPTWQTNFSASIPSAIMPYMCSGAQ